jgi:hypothetical protein
MGNIQNTSHIVCYTPLRENFRLLGITAPEILEKEG